jgi:hypothetical protein
MKLSRFSRRVGAIGGAVVLISCCSVAAFAQGGSSPSSAVPAATAPTTLYSSIVQPFSVTNPPHDWWSLSFAGTSATALGDKVNLTSAVDDLGTATVILDSQGCQTGSGATCSTTAGQTSPVPITLTIYKPGTTGGSVGAVIATSTETFNVPYRPSASPVDCAATTSSIFPGTPNNGTQWFDYATGDCYYGVTYAATFTSADFGAGPFALPRSVVYGISYPTTTSFEQSLNVLLSTESASGAVTVGSDTDPGNLFVSAAVSNDVGGSTGEITCSTVGTTFAEYNTAVGSTGCGTDTAEGSGAPYEPIAFVPAVEIDASS